MYLFFLWEVTYFKNCFMIKKHSNQLFKMSTLIWFVSLLPGPQALTGNPHASTLCHSCSPTSTLEGQLQNLVISGTDEELSTPWQGAQLCTWDIQPQTESFSSKSTQSHKGRFWPAGLWGHKLPNKVPQQTPDLVTRSAKRHSAVLWLLPLQQGSWEQRSIRGPPSLAACTARKWATFPPASKGFTPDLHFSSSQKIQNIYDEVIDVPQRKQRKTRSTELMLS